MKAVCKKLFSLMLVAILLVSAVPFQASAEEVNETVAVTEAATVAAEAAVMEAAADAADAEIVATTPAANAEVVEKEVVYVEFEIHVEAGEFRVGSLEKSKIGSTESTPSEKAVLAVLEDVIGDAAAGYGLMGWKLEDGTAFNSDTDINLNMEFEEDGYYDEKKEESYPLLHVIAILEPVEKNITLDPDGGTVASKKHKVMIGKTYGEYGLLPTPTRSGYSFLGWYKNGSLVENDTEVIDLGELTAKWASGKHTVTYEGYKADEGWTQVGFGSFSVDNNSVLKTAFSNFPTDAQIKAMFTIVSESEGDNLDGWKIAGWEYSNDEGDTWKTFTEGKTKITGTTTIRPLYQKDIRLVANDDGNTTRTLTVTLGKCVPVLPNPGTRETTNDEGKTVNQAFVGWWSNSENGTGELVSNRNNLSNVSAHPIYTPELGDYFVAGWKDACTVYLYIHTNGNTEEHTKLVKYYDVPVTGFDLTTIDLADIFPNYGKYDDKGDEKWGWYNETQWENYCLGRHKYDTTERVDETYFADDDIREFYIMLIDNGNNASSNNANGNGYNDNKTTVDSSNPSTGDNIFMAVTIMAVSACAAVLIFMNKKRIVK